MREMTDVSMLLNCKLSVFSPLQPTHLANFNMVQSIQYSPLEEKDRKGMLQLNVAGAPEVTHTHILTHMHSPKKCTKSDTSGSNMNVNEMLMTHWYFCYFFN